MKNIPQSKPEKKKVIDLWTHVWVVYETGMSMESILSILDLALFNEVAMKQILKDNKLQLIEGKYLVTLDNRMPKVWQVIKFPKVEAPAKKFEKKQQEETPENKRNILYEIQCYIKTKIEDTIDFANTIDSKVYFFAIWGVIIMYIILGWVFYFSCVENQTQEISEVKIAPIETNQYPAILAMNQEPKVIFSEITEEVANEQALAWSYTISSQGDLRNLKSAIDAWNKR